MNTHSVLPSDDERFMLRALELAARGQGLVEPNPMVGCVIVRDGEILGEGWHRGYGGPHAEIEALRACGHAAANSTMYVSLEPCCHQGKTAPCSEAIVAADVRSVVIAQQDPFPRVDGGGIQQLREAGIDVRIGVAANAAQHLNAPYLKLVRQGRPWVIAKWAMTLDGKIASRTGHSQWISSSASRALVHDLRANMDAIIVGRGTAITDDPALTARPPQSRTVSRTALRVVLDSDAQVPLELQVVQSATTTPTLIVCGPNAQAACRENLRAAGCEILVGRAAGYVPRLGELLDELGRRRMTNVLIEGGAQVLGAFIDGDLVDEVHVFVAPKIVGGSQSPSPSAGMGFETISEGLQLEGVSIEQVDEDVHIFGRVRTTRDPG